MAAANGNDQIPLAAGLSIAGAWVRAHKVATLIVLSSLLSIALSFCVLSYRGFCFSQSRFLDEREIFNAAVQHVIDHPVGGIRERQDGRETYSKIATIRYKDLAEFYQENPDCCSFGEFNVGDGPASYFSERLFGYHARLVNVTYMLRFTDDQMRERSKKVVDEVPLSSCGKPYHR